MLFHHVTKGIMGSAAGKTLAGWKNPTSQVFPPDTNAFAHDLNAEMHEAFCLTLFSKVDLPDLHEETRLKPFRDQMVATFLMHTQDYEDDLGQGDLVLSHFMQSASEVGLTRITLWDWSAKVRTRFDLMNSASNIDAATNPEVAQCCQKLGREASDSKNEILAVQRRLNEQNSLLNEQSASIKLLIESNKR